MSDFDADYCWCEHILKYGLCGGCGERPEDCDGDGCVYPVIAMVEPPKEKKKQKKN